MKQIGEYSIDGNLTPNAFLENTCLYLPNKIAKKNKSYKQHVVILNFSTIDKSIDVTFEEIDESSSPKKYLYIGNSKGNKPQISITTSNIKYIFSDTLLLLKERAKGKFLTEINEILNGFFSKKTIKVKDKNVNYYYIKPKVFDFPDEVLGNLNKVVGEIDKATTKKSVENTIETFITSLGKEFINSIKDISKEEISIYSVEIDGKLICQMDEYKEIIFDEKISSLFQKSNKNYKNNYQEGSFCSICGSKDKTTSNSTNLEFKFYNNDNIGFSSNLDEKFTKNYNICEHCYQFLMISEKFIKTNLKTRIGGLSCYLIPSFIQKTKDFDILDFSEDIKKTTNSIVNLESVERSINNIQKTNRDIKTNFTINYLFYVPSSKNDFKVLKLIKDISPYRLKIIRLNLDKINSLIKNEYENVSELKLDLNKIWNCIPIRGKQGDSGGYEGTSRYLSLLDSIFSNRKINTQFLISQFNEVIQILKFERPGYNIKIPEKNARFSDEFNFVFKVLQLNLLLLFLKNLNLLEGFNMLNTTQIDLSSVQNMIPEQILQYWNNVEIYEDDQKKSLFLLGYMIGEVGISQSSQEIKNKPILNKINFQGMSTEKLVRLANEVPEKLKQYGKLNYNENINTAFRIIFESNLRNWKLSNQENVFYVLSGYSYLNYILWKNKKKIKELFIKKSEQINKLKEDNVNVENYEKLLSEAKDLIFGKFKDYKKAKELLAKIYVDEKEVEI